MEKFFFNFFTTLARILWCIVVNLMHKKSGTLLHRFYFSFSVVMVIVFDFVMLSNPLGNSVTLRQSHIVIVTDKISKILID